MRVIYEPQGRAREYAELALNLFNGCSHGCKYCYAPGTMRRTREDFFKRVTPRKDVLKKLERDARDMAAARDERRVLLCFNCDPYQPCEDARGLTRTALKILGEYGIRAAVLTKGGMEASRDFDLMDRHGVWFGTSLSFRLQKSVDRWEPGASSVEDRIWALILAANKQIYTFMSVEPVIEPEEALSLIEELATTGYVNEWRLGKLNHMPEIERQIDWRDYLDRAERILREAGAKWMVKKDLLEAAGAEE